MADYKLSELTEKAALIATDIMHIRTVGAIDQKITGTNLKDSISDLMNITAFIKTLLNDPDVATALATLTIPFSAFMKTLIDDVDASAALTTLGVTPFIKTLLDDGNVATALATLEIPFSAYMKTLIDDVDASAAQTTLGISAYIKTLLDDANVATALATLTIPFTAYMKTLIDDADAATARTTLDVDQASKLVAKVADYTITDADGIKIVDMTTGAADKTVTLPTAADNDDREITLRKVDSAAGKAILNGEGAEVINDTLLWEIIKQYGYVTVKCNGTKWVVLAHEGAIYEQWQVADVGLVDNQIWQECFNLAGVSPGKYKMEYWGVLRTGSSLGIYKYMTLSNASATEEDNKYTGYVRLCGDALLEGHEIFTKSFIRDLAATTTLYLNAKKSAADAAFQLQATDAEAYIRVTRIG